VEAGTSVHTGDAWGDFAREDGHPPLECPGEHTEDIYGYDSYRAPSGRIWHKVTDQPWDPTTEDADLAKAATLCEASFFSAERANFLDAETATEACRAKKLAFHCEPKDDQNRDCTTTRSDTCREPAPDDIVRACTETYEVLRHRRQVIAGCQLSCNLFVYGDALITCEASTGGG